jgi:hypothetical protein
MPQKNGYSFEYPFVDLSAISLQVALEHQEEVVYLEALHLQEVVAYLLVEVTAFHQVVGGALHLQEVVAYLQVGVAAFHQVVVGALHHLEVVA